jgi:hypothetical protein
MREVPLKCNGRACRQVYRDLPGVRVEDDGRAVVSQAGGVLLVEAVHKTGLDQAASAALAPWRKA